MGRRKPNPGWNGRKRRPRKNKLASRKRKKNPWYCSKCYGEFVHRVNLDQHEQRYKGRACKLPKGQRGPARLEAQQQRREAKCSSLHSPVQPSG